MEKKNYIVAIDLGTASVVVAVGTKHADGLVEILSVVSKPSEGVKAGKIENIEQVSRAIRSAVEESEQQLGIRISEAYAGISGDFVRCARHADHVFVAAEHQSCVAQSDVDQLFERMNNVQAPDDEVIMEHLPQNYTVDNNHEVENPVGSFGRKLSATFNFILCQKTPIDRLNMALKRVGIKMQGALANVLVTPESLLSADEKEEGVALVNLGAGVTDITIYHRNVIRYVASIPMGASAINRDIRTMSVPERHVEPLKLQYGAAVADRVSSDIMIRVNGRTAREATEILLHNLAIVVEARATDIAEFVMQEIKDSGYATRLPFGVVLTGGSAKLKDIDELFRRVTGMEVRIAQPEVGLAEESKALVADPAYATVVGLLLKGASLGISSLIEPYVVTPEPAKRPSFTPPTPASTPQFKHVPPRVTEPVSEPAPVVEPDGEPDGEPIQDEFASEEQPAPSRFGRFIKGAFTKITETFTAAEDEEI